MCHDAKSWSLDIQAASCYWFYQDIVTLSGYETPGNMTCVTDGLLLLSDDRFIPDRSCWLTVHNSWQSWKVVMEKGSIQIFRFSVIQFFCWASESCFCPEMFGLNFRAKWYRYVINWAGYFNMLLYGASGAAHLKVLPYQPTSFKNYTLCVAY